MGRVGTRLLNLFQATCSLRGETGWNRFGDAGLLDPAPLAFPNVLEPLGTGRNRLRPDLRLYSSQPVPSCSEPVPGQSWQASIRWVCDESEMGLQPVPQVDPRGSI